MMDEPPQSMVISAASGGLLSVARVQGNPLQAIEKTNMQLKKWQALASPALWLIRRSLLCRGGEEKCPTIVAHCRKRSYDGKTMIDKKQ